MLLGAVSSLVLGVSQASMQLHYPSSSEGAKDIFTNNTNTNACTSFRLDDQGLNAGLTLALRQDGQSDANTPGNTPCGRMTTGGLFYNFEGDGDAIRVDTCVNTNTAPSGVVYIWEGICNATTAFFGTCVGAIVTSTTENTYYENDGCTLVLDTTKANVPYTLFIDADSTNNQVVWIGRGLSSSATSDDEVDLVSNGLCDNFSRIRIPQDGTVFSTELRDYVSPFSSINYCQTSVGGGVGSIGLWYYFNTPKFNVDKVDYALTLCVKDNDDDEVMLPSLFSGSCGDLTCISTAILDSETMTFIPNNCPSGSSPQSTTYRLEANGVRYSILIPKKTNIVALYLNDLQSEFAPNDECENAITLEDGTVTAGSMEGATEENDASLIGPFGPGVTPIGVWYTMPPSNGQRSLSIDQGVYSMMVYKGDCGTHNTPPNLIDGFFGKTSQVTFLQTSVPVYIFVYGLQNNIEIDPTFTITSVMETTPLEFCFAGNNRVNVLVSSDNGDQGEKRRITSKLMRNVQIGDMIQSTTTGKFSEVYSLGHVNHDVPTTYYQIHTTNTAATVGQKPLELTSDHLLWVEMKGMIPASLVQVGDVVLQSSSDEKKEAAAAVQKITIVQRKGAYAPLTKDGTIIVNNILASCYPTLLPNQSSVLLFGNMHALSHMVLTFRRNILSLINNRQQEEAYTKEGIAIWAHQMLPLALWFVQHAHRLVFLLLVLLLGAMLAGVLCMKRRGRRQVDGQQHYGYRIKKY